MYGRDGSIFQPALARGCFLAEDACVLKKRGGIMQQEQPKQLELSGTLV